MHRKAASEVIEVKAESEVCSTFRETNGSVYLISVCSLCRENVLSSSLKYSLGLCCYGNTMEQLWNKIRKCMSLCLAGPIVLIYLSSEIWTGSCGARTCEVLERLLWLCHTNGVESPSAQLNHSTKIPSGFVSVSGDTLEMFLKTNKQKLQTSETTINLT